MASLFSTVQDQCAAQLSAQSFFTTNPAIPVLVENSKDIAQEIANAMAKLGVCVIVMTPKARCRTPAPNHAPIVDRFEVAIQAVESPTLNRALGGTLQPSGLVAEAGAFLLHGFTPAALGNKLMLENIEMIENQDYLIYEARLFTGGGIWETPTRQ